MEGGRRLTSPDSALAAQVFDQLCSATTLKAILAHHRHLCDILHIRPTNFPQFYPKLKAKLRSWKAQALWNKFDKRASHKCYNRGKVCANSRVLVIGAGPCGLRAAIEAQLLGAKVVVVEKRDRITRNNVLHLWPYVIHDLRALGAKKFFGRFCAGAIDHISIRQLQCMLLKVALILGVEIHENVGFEHLIPPQPDQRTGWRAATSPSDHPASQYEFDILIGADGKRNTLDGFKRKEFRGKLAIAITANFINRHTEAEARVEEISGVAFIFNQKFFKDLYATTGIDLENIVYYKDDTHYFVMTAKKHSLIDKGVIINDYPDTAKLLSPDNVNKTALMEYAREAADFSTGCRLPQLDFAVNHYGQPDVAMFDFTSMYAAENASRVIEVGGYRLFMTLVGDSLLEPFWPTGSGCARGFLSSMDACWAMRSLSLGLHPLEVLAERESIYRLLAQTTPENLQRDLNSYTLDPHTRYPNLNNRVVLPLQVRNLFTTDDESSVENFLKAPPTLLHQQELPKKRRRKEFQVQPDTLLHWLQRQVSHYDDIKIENITSSFKDGMALCAIIHRYRPHLLDVHSLDRSQVATNNQLAFDILERELSILPVMTGNEMAECDVPDRLAMLSYLTQIYDAFRGEIPHVKHPRIEDIKELKEEQEKIKHVSRATLEKMTPSQKVNLLGKLTNRTPRRSRRSYHDRESRLEELRRNGAGGKDDFSGRVKEIEAKLRGVHPDKKPKDLLRAIGKIEKTDWNVQQIERKIEENRMGRGMSRQKSEKVPKWSKEQFEDKFTALERKLLAGKNGGDLDNKYAEIDAKLEKLEKKIKEGSALEQGPRGANRVSAMAAHLAGINQAPPSTPALTVAVKNGSSSSSSQAGASEICHFCNKRVYLMERLSAEGKFFHRGCFRCQYCSTSLRLGNYAFDREGKFGSKFYCIQHFGLQGTTTRRVNTARDIEEKAKESTLLKTPASVPESSTPSDVNEAINQTPERVEFENLSDCVDFEEDEWTDRNFGLSANEASDDNRSEESDSSSESEAYAEADEPGGLDPEETLRLAQDWTRKYASHDSSYSESEEEDDDDDGTTETEGDELVRARELRKMEFPSDVAKQDTGSETEVATEDYSTSTSEEKAREDNSATEISTDSEFEHDGTTHTIPDIVISETSSVQVKKGTLEQPKHVQLITHMNGKFQPIDKKKDVKLQLKKIEANPVTKILPINNNNNIDKLKPSSLTPLFNPNRGDYLLNRTQSTEGIASKISLELKKKYLLGSTGISGNVRKSGSASTLDTKFKSLIDQITEQQKLLNPAPEPSPTMQAILQGADKLRLSPNSQLLSGKKELPYEHEFKHICNLKGKEEEKKLEEEEVERGRSPVHETSIVVPQFPRMEVKEVESDSLSSSNLSSSTEDENDEKEKGRETETAVLPPKLEIHNSRGELMDVPMPDVCPTPSSHNRDRLDLVPETINKVITVPSVSGSDTQGQILWQVPTPAALFTLPLSPAEPTGESSPPSPASVRDESTAACLTETEMSDWARDEDGVVSEALEDLEFNINPQFITFRKHQVPKSRRTGRGVAARIARTEDFDDDYTHVCGKVEEKPNFLNVDNLEFMDTGDESSTDSKEDNVIQNKGYVQFVNPNEDELETPVVEEIPPVPIIPPLMERSRDEESAFTDTASEPVTVKDSPLQPPESTPVAADVDFDDDVGQLSAFSNVRNSLDMRKSRKPKQVPYLPCEPVVHVHHFENEVPVRMPTLEKPPPLPITEKEIFKTEPSLPSQPTSPIPMETPPLSPTVTPSSGNKSPTMAMKLEQLSQERIKQKNLIQEMVMNKLKAQGKSPQERKSRRSARVTPTSPRPKSEFFTPLLLNESVERAKSMNTVSPSPKEVFFTPSSHHRQRATSISTASSSKKTGEKGIIEAFSLPDIRKDVFKTPLATTNLRSDLRESARAKFKMMSDEELGLSPEDKLKKYKLKIQKHSAHLSKRVSPDGDTPKSSKEPSERKKSIIQAVSDFFHKKSPSPPKTPSSQSPIKSSDGKNDTAPPVPPPPALYAPSLDESFSEEDSKAAEDNSSTIKKLKTSQRLARQAQSKRLRMAQEVQRQLEELEVRQKELEAQGVSVEKALRGEDIGVHRNEKELLDEWIRLMRARSEARREEKLLVIRGQELELEDRHARLQSQLSVLMASTPEGEKGSEQVAKEGRILREMLEIVERKDSLSREAERQRILDADKEQEVLRMAKLQFGISDKL